MRRRQFLVGAGLGTAAALTHRVAWALPPMERRFENVFVVLAPGGWDVTYIFDPKPDNPDVTAPFGDVVSMGALDLWLSDNRPIAKIFFEAHNSLCAVVNGIQVRSIAHIPCRRRILTGSTAKEAPDLGSILGHELGPGLPVGKLALGSNHFPGTLAFSSVSVGITNQLKAILSKADIYPASAAGGHPDYIPNTAEKAAIRTYLQARVQRERAQRGRLGENRRLLDDFVHSLDQSQILKGYSDDFGERGITLDLTAQTQLAISAVQSGLTRVVMLEDRGNWDTHQTFDQQGFFFEQLFTGLHTLVTQLQATAGRRSGQTMFDESLVVVLSEMARTPKVNLGGGKDHWPYASALLIGPSIKSGVYGATDNKQEAQNVDFSTGLTSSAGEPLMAENLIASILTAAGIDSNIWLADVPPLGGLWS